MGEVPPSGTLKSLPAHGCGYRRTATRAVVLRYGFRGLETRRGRRKAKGNALNSSSMEPGTGTVAGKA